MTRDPTIKVSIGCCWVARRLDPTYKWRIDQPIGIRLNGRVGWVKRSANGAMLRIDALTQPSGALINRLRYDIATARQRLTKRASRRRTRSRATAHSSDAVPSATG